MLKIIDRVIIFTCCLFMGCNGIAKTPQDATLTVGLVAAIVTIIGWFANEFIRKRNEDKRKKIDERAKFLERQIEQFYGPLFNLVNQIVICNHVLYQIKISKNRSDSDKETINNFFQKNYFIPLHEEFNTVLKTKLYLIEGSELPESFYTYLRHAIQEQVQLTLWNNFKIDTSDVRGIPYPNVLYDDIKNGLDNAMLKYFELTSILDKKSGVQETKIKKYTREELA
jgi:hypothetical protein